MPFPRLWKCHRIRTWCLGSSTEPWKAKPPPFQYLRHFHTFFFLILSINGEMRKFSDSPEAPSSRKRGPYLELKRLWDNTEFPHSSPEAPSSRRRGTHWRSSLLSWSVSALLYVRSHHTIKWRLNERLLITRSEKIPSITITTSSCSKLLVSNLK